VTHEWCRLGLGLLITAAFVALILFVSNDMRWVLAIGSITLFGASTWVGSRRGGGGVAFLLLSLPLLALFGSKVMPQLPGLWPHMLFWLGFALLGWIGFRAGSSPTLTIVALVALVVVTGAAAWYGISFVPNAISRALTQVRDDPAPRFTVDRLDGSPYDVEALRDKVVVLDFFATWCPPCFAELPELEEVRRHFETRSDVAILVVANDSGGDTPESIRAFAENRRIELELAYDPGGTAHKAFGFAGLPGLVVIDRTGRIRLTREGYNAAESGFRESLVTLVESL